MKLTIDIEIPGVYYWYAEVGKNMHVDRLYVERIATEFAVQEWHAEVIAINRCLLSTIGAREVYSVEGTLRKHHTVKDSGGGYCDMIADSLFHLQVSVDDGQVIGYDIPTPPSPPQPSSPIIEGPVETIIPSTSSWKPSPDLGDIGRFIESKKEKANRKKTEAEVELLRAKTQTERRKRRS